MSLVMDAYLLSQILTASSLFAILIGAIVLWLDDRRDQRRRAADQRRVEGLCKRMDAAETEVIARPRVRAISTTHNH